MEALVAWCAQRPLQQCVRQVIHVRERRIIQVSNQGQLSGSQRVLSVRRHPRWRRSDRQSAPPHHHILLNRPAGVPVARYFPSQHRKGVQMHADASAMPCVQCGGVQMPLPAWYPRTFGAIRDAEFTATFCKASAPETCEDSIACYRRFHDSWHDVAKAEPHSPTIHGVSQRPMAEAPFAMEAARHQSRGRNRTAAAYAAAELRGRRGAACRAPPGEQPALRSLHAHAHGQGGLVGHVVER